MTSFFLLTWHICNTASKIYLNLFLYILRFGSVQEITRENGSVIIAFNSVVSAREAFKETLKMDGNILRIHYHTSQISKTYIIYSIIKKFRDPLAISSDTSSADNSPVKERLNIPEKSLEKR